MQQNNNSATQPNNTTGQSNGAMRQLNNSKSHAGSRMGQPNNSTGQADGTIKQPNYYTKTPDSVIWQLKNLLRLLWKARRSFKGFGLLLFYCHMLMLFSALTRFNFGAVPEFALLLQMGSIIVPVLFTITTASLFFPRLFWLGIILGLAHLPFAAIMLARTFTKALPEVSAGVLAGILANGSAKGGVEASSASLLGVLDASNGVLLGGSNAVLLGAAPWYAGLVGLLVLLLVSIKLKISAKKSFIIED